MSMLYQDRMIERFPDAYLKSKTSNNYKLLMVVGPELDELSKLMGDMLLAIDIDKAFGKTLDKIATNVGQTRGRVNDAVLRTLIKAKIAADMSEGTIATILDVVGFIIGDEQNRSQIIEMFNDIDNPEPAAFTIVAPIDNIFISGLTLNQFISLIQKIKSAGVRIIADLQGTFEFGEISEYGPEFEFGFADEEQTVGGTLGILYEPDKEDPLPI